MKYCSVQLSLSVMMVGWANNTAYILSANIIRFSEWHDLPCLLTLEHLEEKGGIEATLMSRKAMWHKSCCSNFNAAKVKRAE